VSARRMLKLLEYQWNGALYNEAVKLTRRQD
jgi:hypothetical protein